jgi:hypothetical protein
LTYIEQTKNISQLKTEDERMSPSALVRAIMLCASMFLSGAAMAGPRPNAEITDGIAAVLLAENDKTDGILTVSDNNLYVQCLNSHLLPQWRCESAGLEGQPWLHHVLTPERQAKLAALGFAPDPDTGNFAALIAKTTAPDALAGTILRVLTEAYGVQPEEIDVVAEKLRAARCHRRIKAGHDRGGAILTRAIGLKQDAEKNCKKKSRPGEAEAADDDDDSGGDDTVPAAAPGIDIDARYLTPMAAALERVQRAGPHAYVIFEAAPAYVQCKHDADGKRMYCEAASADAVGKQVARILTPERQAKLIAAGFAPPGRVMNYSRFYPDAEYDMPLLAKALLRILKEAYGYQGAPAMNVRTEAGDKRPLAP